MRADKKKYYRLDDIGVLGTQEKGSEAQRKQDYDRTAEIIKQDKAGKATPLRARKKAS